MKRKPWRPSEDARAAARDRAAFVSKILDERVICEAGTIIGSTSIKPGFAFTVAVPAGSPPVRRWAECDVRPFDVHEVLPRSAGGDPLDSANVLAVCRRCHDWIHRNGRLAREIGLLRSRYART